LDSNIEKIQYNLLNVFFFIGAFVQEYAPNRRLFQF